MQGRGPATAVGRSADARASQSGARLRSDDAVCGQSGSLLEGAHGRECLRAEEPVGRNAKGALNNRHRGAPVVQLEQSLAAAYTEKVERESGLRADDPVHNQPCPLLERPYRLEGARTEDPVSVDAERALHTCDRTATIAELEQCSPQALTRCGPLRTGMR